MRKAVLALLLAVGTSIAAASDFTPDTSWKILQATVRVRPIPESNGIGSGVVIDTTSSSTTVLTAAHVCGISSQVNVDFFVYRARHEIVGIKVVHGKVMKSNPMFDLALIELPECLGEAVAVISSADYAALEVNTPVAVAGCALGEPPIETYGTIAGFETILLRLNCHMIYGNSGGGVFDTRGRLIGIGQGIRGASGHPLPYMSMAIPGSTIDLFLHEKKFR